MSSSANSSVHRTLRGMRCESDGAEDNWADGYTARLVAVACCTDTCSRFSIDTRVRVNQ